MLIMMALIVNFVVKNPNKKDMSGENNPRYGKASWNKGLTKDTDDRVKNNGLSVSKALQDKMSNGWKPFFATDEFWTEEERNKRSEEKKLLYKEHPEKHPNRILASKNYRTYPEKIVYDWLANHNISFIEQYLTESYNGKRYVDFYLPDNNLYIEVDGEYWHSQSKDKDELKDRYAYEIQGIDTLRISSKERIEDKLNNYFVGVV